MLQFESRFESGNLRQARQVYPRVYDLVTSPDTNSVGHTQWFYFAISGMVPGKKYTFNLINLEKTNSQYNFGMQPVMYSNAEREQNGKGWHRTGKNICYMKNTHKRTDYRSKGNRSYHFSVTFSVVFQHQNDVCYLAYVEITRAQLIFSFNAHTRVRAQTSVLPHVPCVR